MLQIRSISMPSYLPEYAPTSTLVLPTATPEQSATQPASVPYFHGRLSRESAEMLMWDRGCLDGMFLLRNCDADMMDFVLSLCCNKKVSHYKIKRTADGAYGLSGNEPSAHFGQSFVGPVELVESAGDQLAAYLVCRPRIPCNRTIESLLPGNYRDVGTADIEVAAREKAAEWGLGENDPKMLLLDVEFSRLVLSTIHEKLSWFHGKISREEAERRMQLGGLIDGKFLVRERDNRTFALCLCHRNALKHYLVDVLPSGQFAIQDGQRFGSLIALVSHYSVMSDGLWCSLTVACSKHDTNFSLSAASQNQTVVGGSLSPGDSTPVPSRDAVNNQSFGKGRGRFSLRGSASTPTVNTVLSSTDQATAAPPPVYSKSSFSGQQKVAVLTPEIIGALKTKAKVSTPDGAPEVPSVSAARKHSAAIDEEVLDLDCRDVFNFAILNTEPQSGSFEPLGDQQSNSKISKSIALPKQKKSFGGSTEVLNEPTAMKTSVLGKLTAMFRTKETPPTATMAAKEPTPVTTGSRWFVSAPDSPSDVVFGSPVLRNEDSRTAEPGARTSFYPDLTGVQNASFKKDSMKKQPPDDDGPTSMDDSHYSFIDDLNDDVILEKDPVYATVDPDYELTSLVKKRQSCPLPVTESIGDFIRKQREKDAAIAEVVTSTSLSPPKEVRLNGAQGVAGGVQVLPSAGQEGAIRRIKRPAPPPPVKAETKGTDTSTVSSSPPSGEKPKLKEAIARGVAVLPPIFVDNRRKDSLTSPTEDKTKTLNDYSQRTYTLEKPSAADDDVKAAEGLKLDEGGGAKPKQLRHRRTMSREESDSHYKSFKKHRRNPMQIDRSTIALQDKLGSGQFGEVFRATFKLGFIDIQFAVKMLKTFDEISANKELLNEARIMTGMDHPHIVRLIGVCEGEPFMLAMELAPLGPLNRYLEEHKETSTKDIIQLMGQVSEGMEYLESKQFVHRDLAARNVLLVNENFAKISDFGMSKALRLDQDYYTVELRGKLPLKWYAPECIYLTRFSTKSDVWSFGITFWEALTFGSKPYEGLIGRDILQMFKDGKRLEQPANCPGEIYDLLRNCWQYKPEDRPSFAELTRSLSKYMDGL